MRHRKKGRKLSKLSKSRKRLLRNLASSLILEEEIETTKPKAKEAQRFTEKLITLAKNSGPDTKKRLMSELGNRERVVRKLLELIGPRFEDRDGGYTRIIKTSNRSGDNAPMARLSLVEKTTPEEAEKIVEE